MLPQPPQVPAIVKLLAHLLELSPLRGVLSSHQKSAISSVLNSPALQHSAKSGLYLFMSMSVHELSLYSSLPPSHRASSHCPDCACQTFQASVSQVLNAATAAAAANHAVSIFPVTLARTGTVSSVSDFTDRNFPSPLYQSLPPQHSKAF